MALAELISGRSVRGDQPAVVAFGRDSAQTTTRDELFERAGRLAAGLEKAGLERGGRVVLMAPNSADWIVSALGVMNAGG
ncbi:MAG: AMP-binding protein, partial [Phycisphaerae bacterium]